MRASITETESTIQQSGLNLEKLAYVSDNSFSQRSVLLICIIFGLIPFLSAVNGCGSGDNSHKIDSRTKVTGAAVVNPLLVNSTITATDASGTSFSLGKTDANGEFSFRAPQECVYPLLLSFSGGYLRNSKTSFQGQLKSVVRNGNFTRASATTISTLLTEIYETLPETNDFERLDQALAILQGLLQDFGVIDYLTTSPVAFSNATAAKSQRLRYTNNYLADLLANDFASDINGAAVDLSSEDFSDLLRSVALDLCDGTWDGKTTSVGDPMATAWLEKSQEELGNSFISTVRGYEPSTTWDLVYKNMTAEPQAAGLSLNATQPSNPVSAPQVQPNTDEFSEHFISSLGKKFKKVIAEHGLIGGVIALKSSNGAQTGNASGMSKAVSIANTDQTTWTAAENMSSTQNMHFRIASVSKTFTSTMILSLIKDGVLNLDQSIDYWLGKVVPEADIITIRMLLQQITGLYNRQIMPGPCTMAKDNITYSFADLIDLSNKASKWSTHFTPGTKHLYADINFIILAWIAETATGKTYKELIKERCLKPAYLFQSSAPKPGNSTMPSPYIHGYDVCEPEFCTLCWKDFSNFNMSWDVGSGNIISTASDLINWLETLDSGELIGSGLSRQMRTVKDNNYVGEIEGLKYYYGMGIEIFRNQYHQTVKFGHDGYDPGYSTYAFKYKGYYMVILLNIANGFHLKDIPLEPAATLKVYSAMEDWLGS
ncbi:MAG: serine hydrolase domain-containing protein [Thermodesulfobacteriota bacterium]